MHGIESFKIMKENVYKKCYRQFVMLHFGTLSHLRLPDLTGPTFLKHLGQSNFV